MPFSWNSQKVARLLYAADELDNWKSVPEWPSDPKLARFLEYDDPHEEAYWFEERIDRLFSELSDDSPWIAIENRPYACGRCHGDGLRFRFRDKVGRLEHLLWNHVNR